MAVKIGLLYWRSSNDPVHYHNAIQGAGAFAVRIDGDALCRLPFMDALALLRADAPDGLLIPGGGDIDSAWWGEALHPSAKCVPAFRDAFEIYLARAYYSRSWPVLGICRGAQVLNVALGGTLYQDMVAQGFEPHQLPDDQGHVVALEEASFIAKAFMSNVGRVNSMHHQAVNAPGNGLVISAWARGRLPEAVEALDGRAYYGVQWHPERMHDDQNAQRLFESFAAVCAKAKA